MACRCGHAKLAHHFSKEGCAVEGCECEKYKAITNLPRRKVCDMCEGTKESPIRGGLSGEIGCHCPKCKGTGWEVPPVIIEDAIESTVEVTDEWNPLDGRTITVEEIEK